MEKFRTLYSGFYHEETITAYGDAHGGVTNLTSPLICDLESGMNNIHGGIAKFVVDLFNDVTPDFDLENLLSTLADPSQDWPKIGSLDTKEHITGRIRRFLSDGIRTSAHPRTPVGDTQHLVGSHGQELRSLAPNNEVLVPNEGVSHLPSLVRSRDSSPMSSDEPDQSNPTSAPSV